MAIEVTTITVMPDYGNGAYAWEKPTNDRSRFVGENIADAGSGFKTKSGRTISAELGSQLATWAVCFERGADDPNFDWPTFHALGVRLSHQLKRELGSTFRVVYHKPVEDPLHDVEHYFEISGDA